MPTTAAQLIAEAKTYLLAGHREPLNRLSGAHNNSTTTFSFSEELEGIIAGAYLSVGLEIVYVWSADPATRTATVQRGMNGSSPAAHSDGAIVTVNPKFPDFLVLQAINNDIRDLSGRGLFRVKTVEITFVAGKYGYDLTQATDVLEGIEARYDAPGRERSWPLLHKWRIRRDSNTTDFPTGFSLILSEDAHPGRAIRVLYSAPYGTLSSLTDDVTTVTGLQELGLDIPALGAALRLEAVREGQRNFNEAQPNPRRSAEVPPGAQITSTRGLMALRDMRIRSLLSILNKKYPNRRRVR